MLVVITMHYFNNKYPVLVSLILKDYGWKCWSSMAQI